MLCLPHMHTSHLNAFESDLICLIYFGYLESLEEKQTLRQANPKKGLCDL